MTRQRSAARVRTARAAVATVVTGLLVVLVGCAAASPSGPHPSDSSAEHARWGIPAAAAPSGMRYQPDVRIVGGGRNVVWGASADAVRWTLDANAPGMADVRAGDVLYASSLVTGRVVSITRQGDRDIVVLAPIMLTDLIKDGSIKYDDTFAPGDGLVAQRVDAPTVTAISGPTDVAGVIKTIADRAPAASNASMPPPVSPSPLSGGPAFTVNGFDVGVTFAPDGLNVSLSKGFLSAKSSKNSSAGLKLGVDFGLHFDKLRVAGSTSITGGHLTSSSTVLSGLKALTLTMTGGAADPAADNTKLRIELPWTFEKALPPMSGIPTVFQAKVTLVVATALTGKNAVISASADYGLSEGANALSNLALTVKKSLVNSIAGISLGPSGVVFGLGFRFLVGVGLPGLAAGPYGKFSVTVGVTNGSSLGASLARCRGATLDISGGIGAAQYLSTEALTGVLGEVGKAFFDKFKIERETAFDKSWSLFNRSVVEPDVPLCKG